MVVTAQFNGEAKLVQEGAKDGIYRWEVMVPLNVSYQDTKGVAIQPINATLEIVRINDEDHPKGIAIHSITAALAPAPAPAPTGATLPPQNR